MTTEISQKEQPDTFTENKTVAKRGGAVAGKARKSAEKELGHPIASKENYLKETEKRRRIPQKQDKETFK